MSEILICHATHDMSYKELDYYSDVGGESISEIMHRSGLSPTDISEAGFYQSSYQLRCGVYDVANLDQLMEQGILTPPANGEPQTIDKLTEFSEEGGPSTYVSSELPIRHLELPEGQDFVGFISQEMAQGTISPVLDGAHNSIIHQVDEVTFKTLSRGDVTTGVVVSPENSVHGFSSDEVAATIFDKIQAERQFVRGEIDYQREVDHDRAIPLDAQMNQIDFTTSAPAAPGLGGN